MLIELTDEKLMQCDGGKTPYQLTVEALRKLNCPLCQGHFELV